MNRRLLPLAALVSLWPVGFIAVSIATASRHGAQDNETVNVAVPSTSTTHSVAPKTAAIRLRLGGRTYECPPGTRNKLRPIDERAGELQLQLRSERRAFVATIGRLNGLDKLYPGHTAPTQAIANEYNSLLRKAHGLQAREARLVRAFNDAADAHNHVLQTDCS
jgi:hypothetical protein